MERLLLFKDAISIYKRVIFLLSVIFTIWLGPSNAQVIIHSTATADSLMYIAWDMRVDNPDSAVILTDTVLESLQGRDIGVIEFDIVLRAANLHRTLNNFSRARHIIGEYKHIAEEDGQEKNRAYMYQVLGITDNQQGRFESAARNFVESLTLYEKIGDKLNTAILLKETGIVYERLKLNDKALEYGKEALRMARELPDSSRLASFLGDLGTMYQNMNLPNEALPYQLESLAVNEKIGDPSSLPFNYHNIGDIYLKLGRFDEAEEFTLKARDGFETYGMPFNALYSMMNLGRIAMERGQYTLANEYMNNALNRAIEFDGIFEQGMLMKHLSELNEKMGRYDVAINFLKQSHSIADSLAGADRERMILSMTEQYRNEQIIREVDQLKQQEALNEQLIVNQRIFLSAILLGFLALVVAVILLINFNRKTKRLNTELIEMNTKLGFLDQERSNLIHVMAHDLKTPMAQVKGLTDLLKETEGITEEHLEYLRLIESASMNGLSLIGQLSISTKREDLDVRKLVMEPVDIKQLVDDSMSSYEAQARVKNIRLVLNDSLQNGVITSNAQSIRRIVDNLVSNAIKYTYPDSSIRVDIDETPQSVIICVQDEGPGFSEADKLLLFRKFTTLSARPTGNEPSTGLGLAIVHDLVKSLNGSIQLKNDTESGACFYLELPK